MLPQAKASVQSLSHTQHHRIVPRKMKRQLLEAKLMRKEEALQRQLQEKRYVKHVLKQRVFNNDVKDRKPAASPKQGPSGVTATAPSSEMNRMNLQGYNKRLTYAEVTRSRKK
ncbi:hypothetical protein DdX_10609 [Ditylenchus destructor]|uniref:Uncharacterized protein n=1 Tax=Ditylenchus destructor TaxID=166010 RepID=A0AAD4N0A5_9BILA|nr:hypothetical protein DdX_10609 [Ditylenchus destructor]